MRIGDNLSAFAAVQLVRFELRHDFTGWHQIPSAQLDANATAYLYAHREFHDLRYDHAASDKNFFLSNENRARNVSPSRIAIPDI
jgi:hypothetical protein